MPYLKGEGVNVGVAVEDPRLTGASAMDKWIPGRTPAGIRVQVDKVQIRETRGTGVSSQGSSIVMKRAEGDLEFNIYDNAIGYLLYSLLGDVASSLVSGASAAWQHVFTIRTGDPEFPTLTLGLSQPGQQDYRYKGALVTQLEISTPVDDLANATATFVAIDEEEVSDYVPSFSDEDSYFRHYDVTIKIAANVAGLAAAQALKVKEFGLTINNNGRVNQNVGELNPGNVLAVLHEISGSMTIDRQDETHHDIYAAEGYKAMSVTFSRPDVVLDAGPTPDATPKLTFVLPKVSYTQLDPDRPIDDIVTEKVEFMAHFDEDEAKAIEVTLVNGVEAYAPSES